MHAPPHLDGHYAPQPECGFRQGEWEFLEIIRRHDVKLVCCAHGLGFDHHVRDGIRFVMTGGGGAALYLSYRNAGGDRGALFHAVEITSPRPVRFAAACCRPSPPAAAPRHSLSATRAAVGHGSRRGLDGLCVLGRRKDVARARMGGDRWARPTGESTACAALYRRRVRGIDRRPTPRVAEERGPVSYVSQRDRSEREHAAACL